MKRKYYPSKTVNGIKKRLHIYVMEEKLGRPLESNEYVYHINGDPHDYSLENLVIIVKNIPRGKNDKPRNTGLTRAPNTF